MPCVFEQYSGKEVVCYFFVAKSEQEGENICILSFSSDGSESHIYKVFAIVFVVSIYHKSRHSHVEKVFAIVFVVSIYHKSRHSHIEKVFAIVFVVSIYHKSRQIIQPFDKQDKMI
jgi:uncharacterized membrane protein